MISEKANRLLFGVKRIISFYLDCLLEKVTEHNEFYEDGVLMSLFKIDKLNYGIEIRMLPENIFPDEVLEDLNLHYG